VYDIMEFMRFSKHYGFTR